jgi:dTMP kinase
MTHTVPHKTMENGRLIMFDGPDGVGKTTQIAMAATALESMGYKIHTSRLSGGTQIGEALRRVSLNPELHRSPLTDLYIMLAMYSALEDDLRSRLAEGFTCLIDRSPLSIMAYQVYGSGLTLEIGQTAVKEALDIFSPDLIICYEASVEKLEAQRSGRDQEELDFFESQTNDYMERVIKGFQAATSMYDVKTVRVLSSADKVHEQTMKILLSVLTSS